MADISKINGVPIANIEKLDAVLAANIAKVNGLVFSTAPAFTGLLDTYTGAAAGYSTRRLASSATVLMRVRRETAGTTGDDDEADIAYDSNNELSLDSAISNASALVTATTLGQFLNVGTVGGTTYTNPDSLTVTASCFTDTWYDQSGNANHAEQTAHGSQPQIHLGTVNTDLILENGKPAMSCSKDFFELTSAINPSEYSVASTLTQSNASMLMGNTDLSTFMWFQTSSAFWMKHGGTTLTLSLSTSIPNSQFLSFINWSGTVGGYGLNGAAFDTGSQSTSPNFTRVLNGYTGNNYAWNSKAQEVIFWNSDQDSAGNRTGIETNIDNYFQIPGM